MTNHFEEAEHFLAEAVESYDRSFRSAGEAPRNEALTRAHYLLSFANAHTALAGIQSQKVGFEFVGKMADSVEKDVIGRLVEGK